MTTTEQEREDLNNTLKDIVTRRGKSVRIPELLEAELEELVDFILQRDARREGESMILVAQLILNTCKYKGRELFLSTSAVEQLLEDLKKRSDEHKVFTALKKLKTSLPSPKPGATDHE